MAVWLAAVWGLTGGLCVEALELYAHIRHAKRWNWRRPIDQGMVAFVVALVIRIGVGSAVASAFAGSHQVSGPLAAFTLGIAAPIVVARLAKSVPLTVGQDDLDQTAPAAHHVHASTGATLGKSHDGNGLQAVTEAIAAGESDAS
jgi:hypothetical protein